MDKKPKEVKKDEEKKKKLSFKFSEKSNANIILLVIFTVILFFITILQFESYKLNLNIGDFAESDIRSPKEMVDEYDTKRQREKAANAVIPRYRISPSVQMDMKDNIIGFIDGVKDLKIRSDINNSQKLKLLEEESIFDLPKASYQYVLNMEYRSLNNFENTLTDLTGQLMGVGISKEDLPYEIDNLEATLESLNLTDSEKLIGLAIMKEIIKPNKFPDELATNRLKKEAAEKIKPIIVKENEVMILKGELIDAHKYNLIKESGLMKDSEQRDNGSNIGIGVLIILGVFFLYSYVRVFHKDILKTNKFLVLLLVIIFTVLISQVIFVISPYIIPVAAGSLLVAILINPELGIMVNLFLSLFLGFLLRLDTGIVSMFVLGGSLGILTLNSQKQRYNILLNGVVIGVVNVLVLTSFGLIKGSLGREFFFKDIQAFANGIISIIITIGSLPLWENIFSILTPIKMLELSNPNQPLLKRLLLEAPGTYHHSLMVGNLGESAAEIIGANPLLTRVGAYYHDIGKLKRPYYFKENQFGMENPHDNLNPYESASIILDHTIEGIKMAKEKRIPKEIIDFIDQHHGTTMVAYFYYKAKKDDENADKEDFRYKGQKPQSKETAIVMLADSTEAAVRSIREPTREKIEEMVYNVVKGKIDDGQLDECDITNKDVQRISKAFVNVLLGIYHDRIEYPNMDALPEGD